MTKCIGLGSARIIKGNPIGYSAKALILAGVLTITGIWQYVINTASAAFGHPTNIPDTSPIISFALIGSGVFLFALNKLVPDVVPALHSSAEICFSASGFNRRLLCYNS